MDIASMSVGMHQANLMDNIGMSVMKMAMNNSNQMVNELSKMMDNMAKEPGKGNVIDTRV